MLLKLTGHSSKELAAAAPGLSRGLDLPVYSAILSFDVLPLGAGYNIPAKKQTNYFF